MNKSLLSLIIFLGLLTNGIGQITNTAYRTVWALDSILDEIPYNPYNSPETTKLEEFEYDNAGRLVMYTYLSEWFLYGVKTSELARKFVFKYDSNGDLIQSELFQNDSISGWVMISSSNISYDHNRNVIQKIDSSLDVNNQLVQIYKWVYLYNAKNQLTSQYYGDSRSSFYERKSTYEYYDYGKIKKTLSYDKSWNDPNPTWYPIGRVTYFYDASHQDSIRLHEEYYRSINAFDSVYLVENNYTSNGLLSYRKTFNNGHWLNEEFYSYDSNDTLRKKEIIGFEDDYGNFVKNHEETKLYDENSNLIFWTQKRNYGNGFRKQFSKSANYVNSLLVEKRDTVFDFYSGTSWSSAYYSYNGNGEVVIQIDSSFNSLGFRFEKVANFSFNANHQLIMDEVYYNYRVTHLNLEP